VFMACQWEDEQTGGHCPTLASRFTGTKFKWFTFTNGAHIDSLDPETYNKWFDFLQLFVARRPPILYAPLVHASAPLVFQAAMGIDNITLPVDPVQLQPTYAGALAEFAKQQPIRVLFDNGAGGSNPGEPLPGFEQSFESLPVPGTTARTWFLGDDGKLVDAPPGAARADSFTWDAKARPPTNFTGDTGSGENGLWTTTPPYKWVQPPSGSAVSYVSDPLSANTTVIGAGAVKIWLRATKKNVDLQATISEVRPDGKEVFVQGGWLRASERKLDAAKSTPLEPVLSLRKRDVRPVPRKSYVAATIPLYYQGHAYRAGSRIRVTISAPNGDQPIWAFAETDPPGTATVTIARSPKTPSSLVLPVVPRVDVPTDLPPCPGLRAEPCRAYQAYANRPVRFRPR
jgi:uncharacterized protein